MTHTPFHYKSLPGVREEANKAGAEIPLSEDLSVLSAPLAFHGRTVRNRLLVQPMEGCDGTNDGAPGELTFRRYARFSAGGAGTVWFEAVAVVPEGRANPRQLILTEKNLDEFKKIVALIKETSFKENGFEPVIIMQATHSGRYSRPEKASTPLIAQNIPEYERAGAIPAERIVTDDYLDTLPERYAESARLAEAAGFDGIDVKACHRYLMNELLSARERSGRYGGSFENRSRLLLNAVEAAAGAVTRGIFVTSRLNAYDGIAYPRGFGVSEKSEAEPDLSEPVELIKILRDRYGFELINITAGNPYFNPHINRPFDRGPYEPPEHPLTGLARMYAITKTIKESCPGVTVVASALSYLRQFSPNAAAGLISDGFADLTGFGREAFAYPEFARDAFNGRMDAKKCCVACGKCTDLMRAGREAGCAVRDDVYRDILKSLT